MAQDHRWTLGSVPADPIVGPATKGIEINQNLF
jgi:hypothetical protein